MAAAAGAKLEGVPMTSEMQQLINDPNFVVEFAIGDPVPDLVPQSKDSGIKMSGVYFKKTKRYIMKKCHMSKDDVRILDMDTGKVVMVSHHPGKNPYAEIDPLGLGNTGDQHAVQGGEWESSCNVSVSFTIIHIWHDLWLCIAACFSFHLLEKKSDKSELHITCIPSLLCKRVWPTLRSDPNPFHVTEDNTSKK